MNEVPKNDKIFFPNLDGLRFLSFLLVFLMHSFAIFYPDIDRTTWYNNLLQRFFSAGDIGVSFFFTLSGFLITFLLLKEKAHSGSIRIGAFYVRRALRIWPLYYAILLFGYFIFPVFRQKLGLPAQESSDPRYIFTFLNNFYKIAQHEIPMFMDVFWSVAVEEQFYLVWPVLFYFTPVRYYLHVIAAIILISNVFRFAFTGTLAIEFHTLGVITDMAVGGLFAYLSIYNASFIKKIKSIPKWFSLLLYLLTLLYIVFGREIFNSTFSVSIKRFIMGLTFAFIIVEQNFSQKSLFKIGNWKTISLLGKYTYGLYCLHGIAIMFCAALFKNGNMPIAGWPLFILESILSLSVSILLAWLSYTYFEKWFLQLKSKFASGG